MGQRPGADQVQIITTGTFEFKPDRRGKWVFGIDSRLPIRLRNRARKPISALEVRGTRPYVKKNRHILPNFVMTETL